MAGNHVSFPLGTSPELPLAAGSSSPVKSKRYSIRDYGSTLVAETSVDVAVHNATSTAFSILAKYIFGKDKPQLKIMVSGLVFHPNFLLEESQSLTADCHLTTTLLIQFTIPETFKVRDVPAPLNPLVRVRQVPPRKVAVYSYSGSWNETRYRKEIGIFLSELESNKITTVGVPTIALCKSPFYMWFLRKNEIWLEILPPIRSESPSDIDDNG